jgi:hypothetical protein
MKEREEHLPDSHLYTSLEQTDHNESGWIRSFHCDLSAPATSTGVNNVEMYIRRANK